MFNIMDQPIQEKTYQIDTYREQIETQVIAVGTADQAPWVAVAECLFHPQGGGQPADIGWIDGHEATAARDQETGLVVTRPLATDPAWPEFSVGQAVTTRIAMPTRMAHAALHTAGHLIEAVGRAHGWELSGNNHFPGQARIEFTTPEPDPRLDDPDQRGALLTRLRVDVAGAIAEDLPVTWETNDVGQRVVRIGDLHSAPCGGTHVRRLSDLADVALSGLKVRRGRVRVSYSAQHRR